MTDVTQDPNAGTPRRPWPADADWWSGDGDGDGETTGKAETTGKVDPAKTDPANPAAPPVSGPAKSVVPESEAPKLPSNTGAEVTEAPANAGLEVAEPAANAVGPLGTGPFESPPKVTRPAPTPRPPATAPSTAPAQLLPAGRVAVTAILPSQPATPTDNLGRADQHSNVGAVEQCDNVADAMVLPASVPAQRSYPPPPPTRPSVRSPQRRRPPRPLWLSLPALVVLALATAFFAWVSAEPFWLAVGHGHTGTATIFTAPSGCRARFVAHDAAFTVSTVEVAGLRGCPNGASPSAQMVSPRGARAYVTDRAGLNARWSIGFGLVVLCGLATATATGSGRLPGWRGTAAVGLSLAAPAVATLVMLAVAY
jgi:hypothetical protein